MIPRTRLIITALLGCHLFVAPALVTSQLRSDTAAAQPALSADSALPSDPQNQTTTGPDQQAAPSKPVTPAPDDEGMRVMEEVVQQQLQSAADEGSGTPRPPANVVLNRDDVLIRADEQEKIQDVYKVRGHVEE